MADLLDIDDPAEVLAAAGRSAVAGAAAVGRAVQTARHLVVHPRECSQFDEDLIARLDSLRGVVTETATATGVRSAATYHQVAQAIPALIDADAVGGRILGNVV
ncbi:hypothetical protein [Nocardia tengchongensis]|uniref:hypothetical protein n=1 Tax=Nocardia tengchongensis TaxID=2055889 RepID=UPI0036C3D7AD